MTRPTPPPLAADANRDGVIDLADAPLWLEVLWGWVKWVFFLPGDTALVVLVVELPAVASGFGLSTARYGGWFSGLFSAFLWCVLVMFALWWWWWWRRGAAAAPG